MKVKMLAVLLGAALLYLNPSSGLGWMLVMIPVASWLLDNSHKIAGLFRTRVRH